LTRKHGIFYKMQIIAMMLLPPRWMSLAVVVALVSATSTAWAQDKIFFKDGKDQEGRITKVANNRVFMRIPSGEIPYPITNIERIDMPPPAQLAKAAGLPAPQQISLLEPLVQQFRGLPVAWLVDAMGQLAAAYSDTNQGDKAMALYKEIQSSFPGSKFEMVAKTGLARERLKDNDISGALALLKPVIEESNKTLMPTRSDSRIFADAYIVRGMALEKNSMDDQALESYLAVVTIFYHNPRALAEAQQKADELRAKNPKAMVR